MPVRVFRNARIHTGMHDRPTVQALAVEGERIVAVGTEDEVRATVAAATAATVAAGRTHADATTGRAPEIVDLDGACVLPGFYDAHIHTASLSRDLSAVDLRGARSLTEALDRVRQFTATLPDSAWLVGGRWDSNRWDIPRQPDRHSLDTACPDRPAVLPSIDGHTVWANSAALQAAGIDRSTPDPVGGEIARDEHGEPTGILRESAATRLRHLATDLDTRDLADLLLLGQDLLLSLGITSVHDIDGEDARTAYLQLRDEQRLKLRVHKAIPVDALELAIEQGRKTGQGDDWVRTGPVKLFADGALGSRTCHLTDPFNASTQPGTSQRGIAVTPYDELLRLVRLASSAGIAVATHAIGDRAVELVLDAYEAAGASPSGALRHRVEHAQHLRLPDVSRMAKLGVVASMQPTHCTTDIDLVDELLGDRPVASYAWRSLLNAGAALAFGSDAPVEEPNPFDGVHAALTRMRPDGTPAGGWQPEQRLGAMEAITAYTLGSAYAAGEEQAKGLLAPGRLADFIAVDTDPLTESADAIRRTTVLTTVVGGEVRWRR